VTDQAQPARPLRFGEALPLEYANSNRNSRFALGSLGGRYILICAIADLEHPAAKAALAAIPLERADETERVVAVFSADARADARIEALSQTRLVFSDPDIAKKCGLIDPRDPAGRWILIDPTLRVLALWPLDASAEALAALALLPSPSLHTGALTPAPVLVAPRVFEPEFCTKLIAYYRDHGGEASGVTQQDATGRTFVALDNAFKRRNDRLIDDAKLRDAIMQRIYWRLAPMIERAFMWRPTRMERYLIACYDAQSGGFFKPHRDNTTAGTAHRHFAVTINLNADDYDGGDLRFPEFGAQTYRAPTGGAVVFSCSMLHEATPVTRGERYAFLPFLYDDAAAKVREANNRYLDESIAPYRDS
jgi:predicted 2-oxoglutarate/Fe(II)-dependent dioxygenase YbiX